ncbi:MAG: hypothetical protein R3E68_21395 [Burkholderiaceae bacterium]
MPARIFLALSPGAIHPAPVQAALALAVARRATLVVTVLSADRHAQAATLSFTREFRLSCGVFRDFGPAMYRQRSPARCAVSNATLTQGRPGSRVQWVLDTAPRPLATMLREYREAGGLTWSIARRGWPPRAQPGLCADHRAAGRIAGRVAGGGNACRAGRSALRLVGVAADSQQAAILREAIAAGLHEQGLASRRGEAPAPVFVGPAGEAGAHLLASLGGHSSLVVARAADLALVGLDEADLARRVGTAVLVLP